MIRERRMHHSCLPLDDHFLGQQQSCLTDSGALCAQCYLKSHNTYNPKSVVAALQFKRKKYITVANTRTILLKYFLNPGFALTGKCMQFKKNFLQKAYDKKC